MPNVLPIVLFLAALTPGQTTPGTGGCKNATLVLGVRSELPEVPLKFLSVRVGGQSADMIRATKDISRRRVIVLLDISGSMTDTPTEPASAEAAKAAGKAVPEGSDALLVTFAEKLYATSHFSSRAEGLKLLSSLQTPKGTHATAVFYAIHQAITMFGEPRAGDSIFLVSDGADNRSRQRLDRTIAELQQRQIRLFTFAVQHPVPNTEEDRDAPAVLSELARQTGAASLVFMVGERTPPVVDAAVNDVRAQVETVYRLELAVPKALHDRAKVQIKFADPAAGKKTHLFFPTAIAPCQ